MMAGKTRRKRAYCMEACSYIKTYEIAGRLMGQMTQLPYIEFFLLTQVVRLNITHVFFTLPCYGS